VGGGPGEAGLITAEGVKWLSRADVVIYDRLINPALLALAPPQAEKIYVGKAGGRHHYPQEKINALLVQKCRQKGLTVRLKGGDPLLFARGSEEAQALRTAGIPFRIVPGVTAATAAGAYAGIPPTDRRAASAVAFVTGHEDPTKQRAGLNWDALAGIDTLVFYMAVANLAGITRQLQAAGKSPDAPAAVVQNAATPHQRTITATLADIADRAARAGIQPPAMLIVGNVVKLREQLSWYEQLPLFGRTVLVTRPAALATMPAGAMPVPDGLADKLTELGAEAISAPAVEITPLQNTKPLDAVLTRLGAGRRAAEFDWLAFTSANGVDAVFARLAAMKLDARALGGVKLAAVGPATAEALGRHGLRADLTPETFTTAALGKTLAAVGSGLKILLLRADAASDELPEALRAAGLHVEQVAAYRTVRPASLPAPAVEALQAGRVHWITFTSPACVANFVALVSHTGRGGVDLSGVKTAAIGPVTAEAVKNANIPLTVVASPHTVAALVSAIAETEQQKSQ